MNMRAPDSGQAGAGLSRTVQSSSLPVTIAAYLPPDQFEQAKAAVARAAAAA
ncbi:MAG TPA: hypothetical protein VMH92_12060 [Acidocella sp.]|nr:hypothetical protein [Acidocella sp.]